MKNKKTIYSWIFYDWANSAFATTIMVAVLPVFYKDVIAKNLENHIATSYWGYTTSIAMIIVAILAPILGSVSDKSNLKKHFFCFFLILGVIGTSLLYVVQAGQYVLTSFIFIIASIGFSGANIFYDSFLPLITTHDNIDYISSLGYASGYLGGGLLLAFNLFTIMKPEIFGITTLMATRLSFISVAIWWILFSIPAIKFLPSDHKKLRHIKLIKYTKKGFKELKNTALHIRNYSELVKFLIAFWLYNDGVGTIMRMATIYGREVGIGSTAIIGALLLTQFIGIPFAILFGKIGKKFGPKTGIKIAIVMYTYISIHGFFLDSALDFWILAFLVGTVQGGIQALSRSLYGSMVPLNKTSEFFGFYGISSKFSAIAGPLIFAFVGQVMGAGRYGIFAISLFFVLGFVLISKVDVKKGRAQAKNVISKATN